MAIARRRLKIIGIIVLALVAAWMIVFYSVPSIHYNIHELLNGRVIRSAELPKSELEKVANRYHIKSIINLRNAHPKEPWYINEKDTAKLDGITLYNMSMPAHAMPSVEQLRDLVKVLKVAKTPMLIHCKNGADRSGFAAAIMVILDSKASLTTAEQQISFRYGAVLPSSVGRQVMPHYAAWLKAHRLHSNRANFLAWVKSRAPLQAKKV